MGALIGAWLVVAVGEGEILAELVVAISRGETLALALLLMDGKDVVVVGTLARLTLCPPARPAPCAPARLTCVWWSRGWWYGGTGSLRGEGG